jgi:hypothetical protein
MSREWSEGMADPFFVSVRLTAEESRWRKPRHLGARHRAMALRSSEAKRSSSSSVLT